jgi:pimeloyl-ACP methyl ester carboxylesterase
MPTAITATLEIAYEDHGPPDGAPVILMHGFPDDVRAWDGVAAPLAAAGHRVIVPYLRGYGPTRFLDPATPRSGQQAAIGNDLRALMDALRIERAALAGYDWGGRAACIVAALWPERVRALVTIGGGYNIQTIAAAGNPASPAQELRLWYIWYFQTERGRAGLAANRRDLCRILWRLWSPNWAFDEAMFARTAASWDNPDFVDVVIHSYRHRHAAAEGDPALAAIESLLAATPPITVPTIMLHGAADGVDPPRGFAPHDDRFTNLAARTIVPIAGHFLPRETPEAVVAALTTLFSAA